MWCIIYKSLGLRYFGTNGAPYPSPVAVPLKKCFLQCTLGF